MVRSSEADSEEAGGGAASSVEEGAVEEGSQTPTAREMWESAAAAAWRVSNARERRCGRTWSVFRDQLLLHTARRKVKLTLATRPTTSLHSPSTPLQIVSAGPTSSSCFNSDTLAWP